MELSRLHARVFAVVVFALAALHVPAAEFFIAPWGSGQGDGSKSKPWDIYSGLADNTKTGSVNKMVRPGDTIWLRGGTYGKGGGSGFGASLRGADGAPIVVRQFPGERAIIDGSLTADGTWITFWGFEIMNSSTNRTVVSDLRPFGLNMLGRGQKAVNLVVHDVGHPGIGFWSIVGPEAEIYGCILWGNGLYCMDADYNGGVRGTGIYAQNTNGSRYITDVISFRNLTTGMKAYTVEGGAEGFRFEGNAIFQNGMDGILVENEKKPINSLTVTDNHFWENKWNRFGDTSRTGIQHHKFLFANNLLARSTPAYGNIAFMRGWTDLVATNNSFIQLSQNSTDQERFVHWELYRTNGSYVVDKNSYYGGRDDLYGNYCPAYGQRVKFSTVRTTQGWEMTGSQYQNSLPAENTVAVRPNKYEAGRGHIIVWNWLSNQVEKVDFSGLGLTNQQTFDVMDVQNFLGRPVLSQQFDVDSPIVSIPLTNTLTTKLIGNVQDVQLEHTDPRFNVFVVLPRYTEPLPPVKLQVVQPK